MLKRIIVFLTMQRYNEIGALANFFSERPDFYYEPTCKRLTNQL